MPQLDIDLFDDFLFFAFVSLLFGFGDDETEESVVEMHGEVALAHYYLEQQKSFDEQARLVKTLVTSSVLSKK